MAARAPDPHPMPQQRPRTRWPLFTRSIWLPTLLAMALGLLIRHAAIEPPHIQHLCDPAPWQGACAPRTAVTLLFRHQEIGWLALLAGIAAAVWRRRWMVRLALMAGAFGLILYSYEPSAVGVLLAALTACRPLNTPPRP